MALGPLTASEQALSQRLSSQANRRLVVVACGRSREVQPRFLGFPFRASSKIWGHPRVTTSELGPRGPEKFKDF
jgi:hypothetical protein